VKGGTNNNDYRFHYSKDYRLNPLIHNSNIFNDTDFVPFLKKGVVVSIFISLLLCPIPSFALKSIHFTEKNGEITFILNATLHNPHGMVHSFTGNASWNEEKGISSATGSLIIPVSSLDTKNKSRDKKMYEYCMETTKYPTITFTLDSVGNIPLTLHQSSTYSVNLFGKLSIKDVTLPVQLPVQFTLKDKQLSLQGFYTLNWKDYNVKDPSFLLIQLNKNMKLLWNITVPFD
jgi:polyisoprenoid-binding protein YceI